MTFTYDPTIDAGKVRLYVGDTVEGDGCRVDGSNFTDEEIDIVLEEEGGDWRRTVAAMCEVLAAEWARVADVTVGPRKESLSKVSERYAKLASTMRSQHGGTRQASGFAASLLRDDGYAEANG